METLVPGVKLTRLPVTIKNIDSVAYGPDGRLYAAGYDGRIHVLHDSDGDGLEDKVDLFWSKPGDLLTPVGILVTQEGVYVAARGKIALLKDTDGDGHADESETVASEWVQETNNSDTRNDAAGLAIDAEGNLYFSLGCMSYSKAWLLDDDGKSRYDRTSERGTILKVSPDRKDREIVATGLRFIVGIDFNRHGDLFATDQEGDTWFPGGNPRDELLHILPGRHYGFPFRHPKYAPDLVDEPSVVGFSPQHQSACGFRFNDQRANRKPFGPKHWNDNAIVTGFSRGKLWRVPLAKTRAGYVGKQIQFAAFESLLTDVAISPTGELLLTGHSGSPDWGAGPAANGHLYKVTFDRSAPQPVTAWSAGPLEVKVAFDRPVALNELETPEIEMGRYVWEGDQYEWIYPGYEVVKAAKRAVCRQLEVSARKISDDGRTVTFTTLPQAWRSRYRITLPGVVAADSGQTSNGSTIELSFDMGGAHAQWSVQGETSASWSGWLPHLDTNVVQTMTAGSADHKRLLQQLQKPGRLAMRSLLVLPGKEVSFRFESSGPFVVQYREKKVKSKPTKKKHVAEFTIAANHAPQHPKPRGGREQVLPTEEVHLAIEVQTGTSDDAFFFDTSYHADYDPHERPLRLEHLIVPWAPNIQPPVESEEDGWSGERIAGDPEKGREIFFGKEANCAACHAFAGRGGTVAADLTVSIHRDPAAVMKDIIEPSRSINPDYVSYLVLTEDGRTLTGLFQSADDERVTLFDSAAKQHTIQRDEIEEIRASSVSLMPTGFDKLGKEKLQNLVAFLCTEDVVAKGNGMATGVIRRDFWLNVPGSGVEALTKLDRFPNQPTGTGLLTRFEGPVNGKNQYGARVYGYVHPPTTGQYTFWLAADDEAELWLSSTDRPEDKKQILSLRRWTRPRRWNAYPEQESKPIQLEAGKRYFIEARHHEATVDDCLAVGWRLPDGKLERPIPGKRLSSADAMK